MVGKMALMKGRSRSTRPVSKRPPNWIVYQPDEVKALVINLYRQGKPPSEIGGILRDEYNVPLVKPIVGKGVVRILREAQVSPNIPEDLYNLMVKVNRIRRHLERNPKDLNNKRGLQITESKIYSLMRYYKRMKLLPQDWRYRSEMITV
ncbi:MAG: 30S ribosomal protein S15 [Candidatus Bathyarchaeia archaeon]